MRATIDDDEAIFTLINTFETSPDRQTRLVASLRRFTEDIAGRLPGFVSASVHASLNGARVVNYVQWRSRAELDAMLQRDDARAHMAEVAALSDQVHPVAYRVVYVGTAP